MNSNKARTLARAICFYPGWGALVELIERISFSWLTSIPPTLHSALQQSTASKKARMPGGQRCHCITQCGLQTLHCSDPGELTGLPTPPHPSPPPHPMATDGIWFWLWACVPSVATIHSICKAQLHCLIPILQLLPGWTKSLPSHVVYVC